MNAFNLNIPMQLFPSLALPLVELFPNLSLGWWTPPNLNLKKYASHGVLRVILQTLAWYPMIETIHPIYGKQTEVLSLLFLCLTVAILGRYTVMKHQIKRVTSIPLWNSHLPHDKREALFTAITYVKPTDINNFEEMTVRYVSLPTKLAGTAFCLIANVLYNNLQSEGDKMELLLVLSVLITGGIGINGLRHGNIAMDCLFRCIFGLGFVGMLHYLGKVSDLIILNRIPLS